MNPTTTTTKTAEVLKTVTDEIVAALEAGAAGKWEMPWNRTAGLPINVESRKSYRGANVLVLWARAQTKKFASNEWGTYKQWAEKKAFVRKGEKGTQIIFWSFRNGQESDDETTEVATTERKTFGFCKGYYVFNADQVEGYVAPAVTPGPNAIGHCFDFFDAIGADVHVGGDRACYSPASDQISMPAIETFKSAELFYSTLGHEHIHWTGSAARCNRDLTGRFGSEAYGMEELVAELGAAFIAAHLGIQSETRQDHINYLGCWLRTLKADPRAIVTIASKAQAAADYLFEAAGAAQAALAA